MNPNDAPIVAPRTAGIGAAPAAVASAPASGAIIDAVAVLLVASERMIAVAVTSAVIAHVDDAPVAATSSWPHCSARPVVLPSVPRRTPPPNTRITPHSIFVASLQVSAGRSGLPDALPGNRNSRQPAISATTSSVRCLSNHAATFGGATNPAIVGNSQPTIATPNAITTAHSPRENGFAAVATARGRSEEHTSE